MGKPLRILIIEDSEDDALLLLRELRDGGYEPISKRVETREDMIAELENQKWDIIISDYSMPVFNGLEALKLVRQRGLDIPFISVSGTIGEDTAIEAMRAGASDYMMKGNLKRLIPAVARELNEAEIRQKRKTAEQALKESESKYRTLIERLNEGVYQSDLEGNYITLNNAGARIFGFDSPDEVIGKYSTANFYIDSTERAKIIEDLRKNGYSVREVQAKRRDGSLLWMLVNNNCRLDENGNIIGYEGVFADTSMQKQAEENHRNTTEKLIKAMESTIEAMALTVGMRDPYTADHQRRVTKLAIAIGHEMALSEDKIYGIRLAGIVHDIGKIKVPAEILTKPGQLSEMEFAMIKMHPQVGYDILTTVDFPWPIATSVLQHHERMNGSGYPAGLSKKDIILEARILAVADVVEAMASHRPYRPALGIDRALDEISGNKDKLYDPDVVNACLRLFKEKEFVFE